MKETLTFARFFEAQYLLPESDPELVGAAYFLTGQINVKPTRGQIGPGFHAGLAYALFVCIKLELSRDDVLRLARESGWSGTF